MVMNLCLVQLHFKFHYIDEPFHAKVNNMGCVCVCELHCDPVDISVAILYQLRRI